MDYKNEFIKFMCDAGVLTFGDFVTKSGRNTPYFINTGNYNSGEQISKLGYFYAKCMQENNVSSNVLFGPAYKGIPLCVTVASALYSEYDKNLNYCFNRKEAKDHGEGGVIVGHNLKDGDVVTIIEDVITAGTAIRESLPIIQACGDISVNSVIISVDRMERGNNQKSAIQEVHEQFGIEVYSIVTINDIINAMQNGIIGGIEYLDKMIEYRKQYGI